METNNFSLPERRPQEIFLRRKKGQFGLIILMEDGTELGQPLSVGEYRNWRDNAGLRVEGVTNGNS